MTISLKRVDDASFVIDAQGPIVAGDAAKLDQLYARICGTSSGVRASADEPGASAKYHRRRP